MDDELFPPEAWTPRLIVGWFIRNVETAAHFAFNGEFLCRRHQLPSMLIAAPPGFPLCKTCTKYLLLLSDADIRAAAIIDHPVHTKPDPSPDSQEKPPAADDSAQDGAK